MQKNLINAILTCALALCVSSAEARRMNPELMQPKNQPVETKQASPPAGIMCKNCDEPSKPPPAGSRVWQPQVNDLATWQQLSVHARDYEFSKFVIDVKTNKIYFVDSNVFTLHSDFVLDYLLKMPRTPANLKDYNRNYSRKKPSFILGYLTHYPNLNEWVFSFWEGDTIDALTILRVSKQLKTTFPIASMKFRPDSSYQERIALGLAKYRVPVIKNSQIYQAMPYQAFNAGEAIGKLHIVEPTQKVENLQFNSDEIVILQQSYPDISHVAGIVTTQFSTPLSHVNLRATAWDIPNAILKTAAKDFANLNGKWVKLAVTEQALTMRAAREDEIKSELEKAQNVNMVSLPQADLTSTELATLNQISLSNITRYGAKTAHLGVMLQGGLPVPNGFGIPFYYYQQHLRKHRMDIGLQSILNDKKFKDKTWRNQQLLDFQAKIKAAPMDAQSFEAIKKRWQNTLQAAPVFVRSSTNAEDLTGFNGAGLYDTIPNVRDDAALEAAIKQVWASLWNTRAVDEREFFGIAQNQVYAAVLVQTGVNASASGVLLTTDIWGHQPRTFTINAKWGLGMRVVEGKKIAEQILYDTGNEGTRVISRSDENTMLVFDKKGGIKEVNVPRSEAIITEQRAKILANLVITTEKLFPQYAVLDIEWVLERDYLGRDRFWLVQARPYVQAKPVGNK